MSSSEIDSYAARSSPIVMAETSTEVGMRPEVEKSYPVPIPNARTMSATTMRQARIRPKPGLSSRWR